MAKLDDLHPGDRVFVKPVQTRGTVLRIKPRPATLRHPVVVALNGTGKERAFAPEELDKMEEAGK